MAPKPLSIQRGSFCSAYNVVSFPRRGESGLHRHLIPACLEATTERFFISGPAPCGSRVRPIQKDDEGVSCHGTYRL